MQLGAVLATACDLLLNAAQVLGGDDRTHLAVRVHAGTDPDLAGVLGHQAP